jgi:hypothetical protein
MQSIKLLILGLSLIYLFNFQTQGTESPETENKTLQGQRGMQREKRERTSLESESSESSKKANLGSSGFIPCKKSDRNVQIKRLTQQSEFVEGTECARIRWVETLDIFSGSKKPEKYIEMPSDIHDKLAYVGNHILAFSELASVNSPYPFNRNILIPHISFLVNRKQNDISKKMFISGGFLYFDTDFNPHMISAFISGKDSTHAAPSYNKYAKAHNNNKQNPHRLPDVCLYSGKEVERKIYRKLNEDPNSQCFYHTEEFFYEMLLAKTKVIRDVAEKVLQANDEIVHVVFDCYSYWDVCEDCQKRFRTEYFRGYIHGKIESIFKDSSFTIPKDIGILPVFRVSSFAKYNKQSLEEMTNAGGGSQVKGGFDSTVVSQSQVVLTTRKKSGNYHYPTIFEKVKTYSKKLEQIIQNGK